MNFSEPQDEDDLMCKKNTPWHEAQVFERGWYSHHAKGAAKRHNALVAELVGLTHENLDLSRSSVLDVGAGGFSLLQRVKTRRGVAVDPLFFGELEQSYADAKIQRVFACAEDLPNLFYFSEFDEVWLFDVVQHVIDPARAVHAASCLARRVRIFEWLHTGLHKLKAKFFTTRFMRWEKKVEATGRVNHLGFTGEYFFAVYER
jgi:2-polyprenyl-3-methyl-5-hydroxy-6-metoxy-1,4-benzoquinol methylase